MNWAIPFALELSERAWGLNVDSHSAMARERFAGMPAATDSWAIADLIRPCVQTIGSGGRIVYSAEGKVAAKVVEIRPILIDIF